MSTLHAVQLQCNPNLKLSNDGGDLTNDAGMAMIVEFLNQIKFRAMAHNTLHFNDTRSGGHDYCDLMIQKILMNIIGYHHDCAADHLRLDPAINALLGDHGFVSQPSLSRFFSNINAQNIEELRELIWQVAALVFKLKAQKEFILDIDSTHSDTFGRQEKAAFNAHYMAFGYHPQVLFEQSTGLLLDALMRPGNTYTGHDADQFIMRTFDHLRDLSDQAKVIVRGDSGFAAPAFYEACVDHGCGFIVRLKANAKLQRLAEVKVSDVKLDTGDSVSVYHELNYQANSWTAPYRVIVRSEHVAGELAFWNHTFIVTNLEAVKAERLFPFYQARGNVENDIKALKTGFGFDKTDSSKYVSNAARALISGLAYNLIQTFKQLFISEDPGITIDTLRLTLFHTAGRITHHARQTIIHFATHYVYARWFWRLIIDIQTLNI